jgi:hypothetical protein
VEEEARVAVAPQPVRKRGRVRVVRVVIVIVLAIAIFAAGVAVGGSFRKNPGTSQLLTGTAGVQVVTITETQP